MLDAPIRKALATPLNAAAGTLQRVGLSANAVTVIGFVLGLIAVGAIASEAYVAGVLFLLLNRAADGLDGALARRTRETQMGAFLDASLGFVILLGVPFAYAISHQTNGLAAAFLMLGLTLMSVTNLAAYAFAPRSAIAAADQHPVLCEKTETFVVFVLMAPLWWAFAFLAYILGALCLLSAGLRFAAVTSSLSNAAKS